MRKSGAPLHGKINCGVTCNESYTRDRNNNMEYLNYIIHSFQSGGNVAEAVMAVKTNVAALSVGTVNTDHALIAAAAAIAAGVAIYIYRHRRVR